MSKSKIKKLISWLKKNKNISLSNDLNIAILKVIGNFYIKKTITFIRQIEEYVIFYEFIL